MRLKLQIIILFALTIYSTHAQNSPAQIVFKTGPNDATITESIDSGKKNLSLTKVDNGGRAASSTIGNHTFTISADGYIAKTINIDIKKNNQLIEIKLERENSALKLFAILETGLRPKSVEYSPDGKYIIVAPLSASYINIFDAKTYSLIASPAPAKKWADKQGFVESAFPLGRNEIWVSQMYTNMIHVFSLTDFSYLRSVSCGGNFPKVICPHADGRVFISNWLSETVSVLSSDGLTRVASIPIKGIPRGLALSPDGQKLFVANFTNGCIEIFDTTSYKKIKTIFNGSSETSGPAGGAKRHLVIDNKANILYASDLAKGSVFVYDTNADKYIKEINIAPNAKTNTIALSPDGAYLYVSTRGPNNVIDYELKGPAFGELIVIDTKSLKIIERHWGGNQPTGLAVSPDGNTILFTDFLDHKLEIYKRKP